MENENTKRNDQIWNKDKIIKKLQTITALKLLTERLNNLKRLNLNYNSIITQKLTNETKIT